MTYDNPILKELSGYFKAGEPLRCRCDGHPQLRGEYYGSMGKNVKVLCLFFVVALELIADNYESDVYAQQCRMGLWGEESQTVQGFIDTQESNLKIWEAKHPDKGRVYMTPIYTEKGIEVLTSSCPVSVEPTSGFVLRKSNEAKNEDSNFGNDFAIRHDTDLPPILSSGQTWQEREQKLAKRISTEGTLASYLVGLPRKELELQSLIAAGKAAEAKELYDDLYATIDANRVNLSAVGAMDARNGANAKLLVEQAQRALRYDFNKLVVTTVDGRETTLGRFFADPNMYKNPGKPFEEKGFSHGVVEAFIKSNDENLRRALGFFINCSQCKISCGVADGLVLAPVRDCEAADAILNRWKDISRIFHDQSIRFTQYVYTYLHSKGRHCNVSILVSNLCELGKMFANVTEETGDSLFQEMFKMYDEVIDVIAVNNFKNAAKEVRKHAEQGNCEMQFLLGMFFEHGCGVFQSDAMALRWYRQAAERGNMSAKVAYKKLAGKDCK